VNLFLPGGVYMVLEGSAMQHSPSFAGCVPSGGTWPRSHLSVVLILAILTAVAAGGLAIWYDLNSWISLPLL
jgi:hypothetical protein